MKWPSLICYLSYCIAIMLRHHLEILVASVATKFLVAASIEASLTIEPCGLLVYNVFLICNSCVAVIRLVLNLISSRASL